MEKSAQHTNLKRIGKEERSEEELQIEKSISIDIKFSLKIVYADNYNKDRTCSLSVVQLCSFFFLFFVLPFTNTHSAAHVGVRRAAATKKKHRQNGKNKGKKMYVENVEYNMGNNTEDTRWKWEKWFNIIEMVSYCTYGSPLIWLRAETIHNDNDDILL